MPTYSVEFGFDEDLSFSKEIVADSFEDALKQAREIKTRSLLAKGVDWFDGHPVVKGVSLR